MLNVRLIVLFDVLQKLVQFCLMLTMLNCWSSFKLDMRISHEDNVKIHIFVFLS